mgnify:CR=1 FL=1
MIAPCVRIQGASRGALYATPAGAATPVALPAVSLEGQPLRSHQGSRGVPAVLCSRRWSVLICGAQAWTICKKTNFRAKHALGPFRGACFCGNCKTFIENAHFQIFGHIFGQNIFSGRTAFQACRTCQKSETVVIFRLSVFGKQMFRQVCEPPKRQKCDTIINCWAPTFSGKFSGNFRAISTVPKT